MPPHQCRDGRLIAMLDKARQQLRIAEPGIDLPQHNPVQMANDILHWRLHGTPVGGINGCRLHNKVPDAV
jgi:hypothetical protein